MEDKINVIVVRHPGIGIKVACVEFGARGLNEPHMIGILRGQGLGATCGGGLTECVESIVISAAGL